MQDELFVIRDLNRLDAEIAQAQARLRGGVDAVKGTTAAITASKGRLQAAEAELTLQRTTEHQRTRRLRELTQSRDKTDKLINAGQAPDYDLALQQLSQQAVLVDDAETDLLMTMEAREEAEAELSAATEALAAARTADAAAREDYRARSPGLKAAIAEKTAARPALLEKIAPDHRRQYRDLRGLGLDALAFVVKGACSICFQSTPAQISNEILSGRRIHTCRGCGRFFFAVRVESD
jgi:predicted  nucleic acid-binding Zn-ribbon protein